MAKKITESATNAVGKRRKLSDKEKELKDLTKRYKTLLGRLETQQGNIEAETKRIEDIQQQILLQVAPLMAKVEDLKAAIIDKMKEAEQLAKLDAETRKNIENKRKLLTGEPVNLFGGNDLDDDENDEEPFENDDFFENNEDEPRFADDEGPKFKSLRDFIESLKPQVNEEEKRDIRKIYIRLASRFHPDKARNNEEAEILLRLMQRINDANENEDVAELLAIEAEFEDFDLSSYQATAKVEDFIHTQIERMKKKVEMIENQIERVKQQKRNLMKTEIGNAIKAAKELDKDGFDPIQMSIKEQQDQIDSLENLKKGFESLLKKGKAPKIVKEFISPPAFSFNILEEMLEMFDEMRSRGR